MKINKIIKLKNNKYKIKLDNEEVITYDEVILNYNLLYKNTIDDILYHIIVKETAFYDIYNEVLKFALKKVRCVKEIKEYLLNKDINARDKQKIIDKLVNLKIVNDLMYTRAYINDKTLLSKAGINKIKEHLVQCDIDSDIIESELAKIELNVFNDKLTKLIKKKIQANTKYSNVELKNKILYSMLNLGYDREEILDIIDSNLKDDYPFLIKEYHKLYNKLSGKYQDNELIYQIKNKLYQKGFNYSDIKKEDLV